MTGRALTVTTLLVLILALGVLFRFHDAAAVPPGLDPDEAYNGTDALIALHDHSFKVFYPLNAGREGLFINLQALAVHVLGNEPVVLRLPSRIFGSLTILVVFLAARELFRFFRDEASEPLPIAADAVALLAAFLTATSFWHLVFSRIGYRAITDPLTSTACLWLFMMGLRRRSTPMLAAAGFVAGLGLYGYTTFKFTVLPLAYLVLDHLRRTQPRLWSLATVRSALRDPGLRAFAAAAVVTALPYLYLVVTSPRLLFRHAALVSVMNTANPLLELLASIGAVAGMFFVHGDPNWRHNISGMPLLHPLVMLFFLSGLLLAVATVVRAILARGPDQTPQVVHPVLSVPAPLAGFLLLWLAAMLVPSVLTYEGRPHALRAIGAIPPTMILAAFGAVHLAQLLVSATLGRRLERVGWSVIAMLGFLVLAAWTHAAYFGLWADHPGTKRAFLWDATAIARHLQSLPDGVEKYVVVGRTKKGVPVDRSWLVQPIAFLTGTATKDGQDARHLRYILPEEIAALPPSGAPRVFVLAEVPLPRVEAAIRAVAPNASIETFVDTATPPTAAGRRP